MKIDASTPWSQVIDHAVALRRGLHRQPELTWEEQQTAARIRQELDELGIPWVTCAETGTIGRLAPQAEGPHIALRADIDALPIVEDSAAEWASERPGTMHACGHDGHTATLVAAAAWLKQREAQLPGPVSLLFQPAEEGGHGARAMIADGALEGIDRIFGWHNWPGIPRGHALCPDGIVMCANGTFEIEVVGHGGHASQPEACRDPVLAAAAITVSLQQVVSRRFSPLEPTVVSVTSLVADSKDTVIPSQARLGGSIRAASLASRDRLERAIDEVCHATAQAHGVKAKVTHHPRYGATINNAQAAQTMRAALDAELGTQWRDHDLLSPLMASEDFSYYLNQIPGCFAIIGAGESADAYPCHSPHYDFNDHLIAPVARIYARLAGLPVPSDAAATHTPGDSAP